MTMFWTETLLGSARSVRAIRILGDNIAERAKKRNPQIIAAVPHRRSEYQRFGECDFESHLKTFSRLDFLVTRSVVA